MKINLLPSAETGNINVAPNLLASTAVEVSKGRFSVVHESVAAVLRAIPAPADVVPMTATEAKTRQVVNEAFIRMVEPLEKQYNDEQFNNLTVDLEREYVNQQFDEIAANMQASVPHVPAPTDHISLTGDEHPNQAAIDEAMLLAMEAYAQDDHQDTEV